MNIVEKKDKNKNNERDNSLPLHIPTDLPLSGIERRLLSKFIYQVFLY